MSFTWSLAGRRCAKRVGENQEAFVKTNFADIDPWDIPLGCLYRVGEDISGPTQEVAYWKADVVKAIQQKLGMDYQTAIADPARIFKSWDYRSSRLGETSGLNHGTLINDVLSEVSKLLLKSGSSWTQVQDYWTVEEIVREVTRSCLEISPSQFSQEQILEWDDGGYLTDDNNRDKDVFEEPELPEVHTGSQIVAMIKERTSSDDTVNEGHLKPEVAREIATTVLEGVFPLTSRSERSTMKDLFCSYLCRYLPDFSPEDMYKSILCTHCYNLWLLGYHKAHLRKKTPSFGMQAIDEVNTTDFSKYNCGRWNWERQTEIGGNGANRGNGEKKKTGGGGLARYKLTKQRGVETWRVEPRDVRVEEFVAHIFFDVKDRFGSNWFWNMIRSRV
ncbi:hypothetical protein ABW19_dt0210210 [Dactylella cylindrospora]|nr:hypothetical protein ABW19_dt0210210 [Dactylella cylindrospora]